MLCLFSLRTANVDPCTAMIKFPTGIDLCRVRQQSPTIWCCENDQGCHPAEKTKQARVYMAAGLPSTWFTKRQWRVWGWGACWVTGGGIST
jgi:hypothetical protein